MTMRTYTLLCALMVFVSMQSMDFNPSEHLKGGKAGGVVGSIPMEIGVNNTGAATFSIPIELPQGCGGLMPELSINYNSLAGNGLFGRGVDLNGISAIYRTSATRYVNGYDRGVYFDKDDALCLDGQPMIRDADNPLKYHCLVEDVYDIIADDADNPQHFTLRDGNGIIKEFGLSENSRIYGRKNSLSAGTQVFAWLLERVIDGYGNYYTISYNNLNHISKGVSIANIKYSGNINAGIEPNMEIRFLNYSLTQGETSYHGDNMYFKESGLKSIMIFSDDKRLKTYEFGYENYNNTTGTYLKSITIEGNEWKTKYNPIEFTWQHPVAGINDPVRYSIGGINSASAYLGDYNGDGLPDILIAPNDNTSWKNFKYYLNNGGGGFGLQKEFEVVLKGGVSYMPNKPNKLMMTYVADFNGDGRDDLMFEGLVAANKRRMEIYLSDGNGFYDSNIDLDFTDDNARIIGDFNGDGAADVMFATPGTTTAHFIVSQFSDNKITPLSLSFPVNLSEAWEEIQVGNFDGGHNTDIINLYEYGHTCYALNEETHTLDILYKGGYPNRSETHYLGDFNGDGKTDVVMTTYNSNKNLVREVPVMCLCTGTQFVTKNMERYGATVFHYDRKILVSDVNGDGKDDFISIPNSNSVSKNSILTLLSLGNGIKYKQEMYLSDNIVPADKCFYGMHDIYGEGKNTLFGLPHTDQHISGEYLIYNERTPCENVITGISDCMGNTTTFNYERWTDYSNSPFIEVWEDYPYSGCSMPMALVKKMVQSNVRGDELTTSYDYKEARTHLGKASFLGFKHVVTTGSDKKTRHDYYDLDPDFGMLNTCSQTFSQDNILLQNDSTQYVQQTSDNGVSLVFPNNIVSRHYSPVNRSNYLTKEIQRTYDNWGNILTECTITNENIVETSKYKYNSALIDSLHWIHRLSEKETIIESNGIKGKIHKESYINSHYIKPLQLYVYVGRNEIIHKEVHKYDTFGNVISSLTGVSSMDTSKHRKVNYLFSDEGKYCIKESGEMDFYRTYEYDAYGNRTLIASSDGVADSTSYDSFGNPKVNVHNGIKTEKGRVWSNGIAMNPTYGVYCEYSRQGSNPYHLIFFDSRGNKLRECDEINGKTVFVDYEYDNNGRLISESLPYFSGEDKKETLYSYDELGNLITKVLPNGYTQSMEYDYSIDGVATTVSTESGESIHLVDHFNRLVWSENELGQRVDYSYNAAGECTTADVDGLITPFSYLRSGGGLSSYISKNEELGTTRYIHNEFGDLYQKTRADFRSTNNTYNKLGYVTKRSTGSDYVFSYSYFDGKPDCIETVSNPSKGYKHEFTYDTYNRPLTETYSFNDTIYTTACDYDNDGRVKEFTYPNGLKLQYEYSGNLLTAIKNAADGSDIWRASEFNAGGKPTKCTYGSVVTANMEYDSSTGRMLKAQYDSLLTINYTLNNRGLIASKTCNTIIPLNYSYDKIGRLISSVYKIEMIRPEFPVNPIDPVYPYEPIALNTYSNDYFIPRDSMIFNPDFPQKPVYAKFEQHYSYDDHNNVQALGGATFSSITYADGATRIVENKLDSAAIRWNNISFADINRIAEIDNATDTLLLDYGENDERIRSTLTTAGTKISRHYVSSFFENIYVDGQSIPVCYITANNKLVAVFVQGAMYYVLTDHLGSVIKVVDENRNIVADYNYSDWGYQSVSKKEEDAHPWLHYFNRGYCGHEHLPEFSLINMDARIYDPVDMRFLSPDPYVQNPMLPQNFNRYSYCLNNPINYTDPTGELFGIDNFIIGFWTGLFKGGLDRAFSEGWKSMKNCYKIRLGLFKSGHSSFLKQVFEVGSRFTWQLPQTVLGYAWAETNNTLGFVKDVDYYGGATIVRTKMISSSVAVTMGSYIVGGSHLVADPRTELFQHEYGHYLQSQKWGPLWVSVFGVPSIGSMIFDKANHDRFYTEVDANNKAFEYFRKNEPGFKFEDWKWGGNPTYDFLHSNLSIEDYIKRNDSRKDHGINLRDLGRVLNTK